MNTVKDNTLSIKQYLLGALSEEEQISIEERYFTNPAYLQEIEMVEDEMVEDYLRGALSSGEKEKFEKNCLPLPRYSDKIQVAQVMQRYTQNYAGYDHQPEHDSPTLAKETVLPPSKRTARIYYFLVPVILLLLVAGLWLIKMRSGSNQQQRLLIEQQLSALNHQNGADQIQADYTIELLSLRTRGSKETKISDLPAGVNIAQFNLSVPNASEKNFAAVFLNDSAEELFAIKDLTASPVGDAGRVSLKLPGNLLKAGDYQISLRQQAVDDSTEVANYYFRVVSP